MERTGSAQKLLWAARRGLETVSWDDLWATLDEVVVGAAEIRGAHVEEALGRMGRRTTDIEIRDGKVGGGDGQEVGLGMWQEAVAVVREAVGEARECGDWWGCLRTALRVVRGR